MVDSGTYDPETVARHQRIADTLLKQAAAPREIRSRLQGIGQLGEGLIAGLSARGADQEAKDARAAMIAQGLQAYGIGAPPVVAPNAAAPVADATAGPPTVAPTGSGFVLPPTERTYAENELNPIDAKIATPSELAAGANISPKDMNVGARTVIGEAGGYKPRDKQAVAAVLLNRARMAGTTPAEEALKPNQFEPWNTEAGRSRMMAPSDSSPAYQDAARAIFMASQADPTGGATHFYSPTAQASLGRRPPNWDTGDGTDIGPHRFFNKPYGNVAAALTAPQATAFADAGPPQSDVAAPPWQLADRFNASYGNRAPVPQQQASLPPPQAAPQVAPPPQTAPSPAGGAPGVAAALNAPVQVAQNAPQQGSREAQVRFGLNPWAPPAAASAVLGQLTPHWTFVPNASHDQYGNPVGAFVDANSRQAVGLDGKPIALNTTQNGPPASGLTGDDYLKTLPSDKAASVKAIAEGRVPYPSGFVMKTPYGQWLQSALSQYKPDLTAQDYGTIAKTRANYTSGPAFQEIKALNTAIGHAAHLYDTSGKLGGTDIAPGYLNPLIQGAKKNVGDKDFQESQKDWDTFSETLATETAKALNGGTPRVSDKEHWREILSKADGPTQRIAAIKSIMGVLEGRVTPLEKGYEQGMKSAGEPLNVVNPENKLRFERLLMGQNPNEKSDAGGTPAAGGGATQSTFTPPSNWQFSASRKQYRDPQGKLYDQNGQPVK